MAEEIFEDKFTQPITENSTDIVKQLRNQKNSQRGSNSRGRGRVYKILQQQSSYAHYIQN